MAKQYAVVHIEKGKGSGGALGHHIDRTEGKEYSYKHSDPSLKDLNQNFELNKYSSMPLQKAISERIKDGYTSKRKINDNAVTHLKIVLTGSHEKMKEIEGNHDKLNQWVIENKKFLEEKYGKENIVRFTLHRDEKTPHLHAVIVPLTSDGRLSAFEVLGNKTKMKALQNDYAKAMAPFGLERGIENTGIKHEDAKAYYSRMEKANEAANNTEINVSKGFLGNYKYESVEELKESVKSLKSALKSKDLEIEGKDRRVRDTAERNQALKQGKDMIQSNYTKLISDERLYQQERNKAIEQIKKELVFEVGKKVEYKFSLKFENNDQRADYAMRQIKAVVKEKNMLVPLVNEAMKDQETARKILEKIEKREQSRDREQNRSFSR